MAYHSPPLKKAKEQAGKCHYPVSCLKNVELRDRIETEGG